MKKETLLDRLLHEAGQCATHETPYSDVVAYCASLAALYRGVTDEEIVNAPPDDAHSVIRDAYRYIRQHPELIAGPKFHVYHGIILLWTQIASHRLNGSTRSIRYSELRLVAA